MQVVRRRQLHPYWGSVVMGLRGSLQVLLTLLPGLIKGELRGRDSKPSLKSRNGNLLIAAPRKLYKNSFPLKPRQCEVEQGTLSSLRN